MGLLCDKLQIIMTETVSSPASGARSRIAVALALLQGFLIILLCLFAGKLIAAYLPFVFPGTIIGLFILFLLLNMKILPVSRVMDAGAVLMAGMPLFYIPAATGIVEYLPELRESLPVILVSVVLGVVLIILGTGGTFQYLAETPQEKARRKNLFRRARNIRALRRERAAAALENRGAGHD